MYDQSDIISDTFFFVLFITVVHVKGLNLLALYSLIQNIMKYITKSQYKKHLWRRNYKNMMCM